MEQQALNLREKSKAGFSRALDNMANRGVPFFSYMRQY